MTDRDLIITLLNEAADRHGVDRRFVHAIAHIESRHRQVDAQGRVLRSRAGALGVMQLMPDTARGLNVNPLNLEDNIEGGVKYFRQRLELAGGDVPTAIAMYYAGIGNVRERGALQWQGVQRYIRNFHALVNNPDIVAMAERGATPIAVTEQVQAPVAPVTTITPVRGVEVGLLGAFVVVILLILILGGR